MLAAVVVVLVFVVASRFLGPLPAALVSLLPFAGPQVETWIRLGPNEAYAVPLALAGLAVITLRAANGRRAPLDAAPGYALLALSALAKENFITLIPAAAIVSLTMSWRRMRRVDSLVLAVLAVVTLADLAVMAWKVGEYGTLYPQDRSVGAVLREGQLMVETQIREAWIWLPILAVATALLARLFTRQVAGAMGTRTPAGGYRSSTSWPEPCPKVAISTRWRSWPAWSGGWPSGWRRGRRGRVP